MLIAATCQANATTPGAGEVDEGSAAAGVSQTAPQSPPCGDVVFQSVLSLQQNPPALEPRLRGGVVAKSTDWPASFYVTFNTPRGTSACTAALLGPKVMLTAAHCVPSSGQVRFVFDNRTYEVACTRHPDYPAADASADFALCEVATSFSPPSGFLFETVETEAGLDSQQGGKVLLAGYGCISDAVAVKEADGRYRIGFNKIDETSLSTSRKHGAVFYSPAGELNNLITLDEGANLCPGDSGGPAFRIDPPTGGGEFSKRRVVGVNSRVFYRDSSQTNYGASLVSSTNGPDFHTWADQWAASRNVAACGLRGSIQNCR